MPKRNLKTRNDSGLTLIELLVVIALVAIVAGITFPMLINTIQTSRVKADERSRTEVVLFVNTWTPQGYPIYQSGQNIVAFEDINKDGIYQLGDDVEMAQIKGNLGGGGGGGGGGTPPVTTVRYGDVTPDSTFAKYGVGFLEGVAVDGAGNRYVLGGDPYVPNQRIEVYAPDATRDTAPMRAITGIAPAGGGVAAFTVDAAGNVFTSAWNDTTAFINVYAPGASGNAVAIHKHLNGGHQFIALAMAIGPQGTLVTEDGDGTIATYAAAASNDDAAIRAFSSGIRPGTTGGLAVNGAGEIYVVNQDLRGITVFEANAAGAATPLRTIRGDNTGIAYAQGIAVNAEGQLYVADDNNRNIAVFAANATGNVAPLGTINKPSADSWSWFTMAIGPDGSLYAASGGWAYLSNEGGVQVFKPAV